MADKIKGKCKYCGKEYSKTYMLRHLKACKKRAEKLGAEKQTPSEGWFLLEITETYDDCCRLFIEASENITLRKTDEFLRDIWLECCGHLSEFKINGVSYNDFPDDGWGSPSRSTNIKLKKVLSVGMKIKYEYDFGSTTHLTIKVKDYRTGGRKKRKADHTFKKQPHRTYLSNMRKGSCRFYIYGFLLRR